MQTYRSHKLVQAAPIMRIVRHAEPPHGIDHFFIRLPDDTEVEVVPDPAMFSRYTPVEGDYLVVYEPDGYRSISPKAVFEAGYSAAVDGDPKPAAPAQAPTIGRIVHYRLSEADVIGTTKRREDAHRNRDRMREERPGFQAHVGNPVTEGQIVPMVITAVWAAGKVNGQALLDGTDSLWVTSAERGDAPSQWNWPPRA